MKIEITGGVAAVPVYKDGKYQGSKKYTSQDGVIDVEDSIAKVLIKQNAAKAVTPKPVEPKAKKEDEPVKEKKEEKPEVKNEPLKPGRKRI